MISFNKDVLEVFHLVIQEPERQRSYIALVGVKLGGSRFGSSQLEDGVRQEDFGT